jgi:hypothetical protein
MFVFMACTWPINLTLAAETLELQNRRENKSEGQWVMNWKEGAACARKAIL